MKRILFTHSYFLKFDPKQWQIMQPYAPLGTIMAASVVREAGYAPYLWDPMFAYDAHELESEIGSIQPEVLVIYDDGFNYLTKMCLTNMREAAFEMIKIASQHHIPVVVCSSDATDHYEKYLDRGAAAVIKGEGEITLVAYLDALKNKSETFDTIAGLIYRKENKTLVNKSRDALKNLDALPLPAWDLVDMNRYQKAWRKKNGYFSINMSTTRGCPYKCNWCAKPIYGNRYNSRSAEHVLDEIKFLIANYSPDHIWFCDDIFGLKPGWVKQFSELIKQSEINIKYKIQSRADLLLQENNISALADSGCETVWVGAESGSQTVLDAMDKGTSVEQINEATLLLKKYNIKPAFFLQFGYPGETKAAIQQTIRMVKSLLPYDIGISVSYPLPGTVFYDKVKSELKTKANWSDSDELAMMFNSTYPSGFYKHLHRFVHKSYRIHQGSQLIKQIVYGKIPAERTSWKRIAGVVFHQPGKWFHYYKMQQYNEVNKTFESAVENEVNVKLAFDKAASSYDEQFTDSTAGSVQRKQVYQFLKKKIDPHIYTNVLELNCGTGTDAIWFSQRGFSILSTDISSEMIRIAEKKVVGHQLDNPPKFSTMSFNELINLKEKEYDLIFSNFGGLNCAEPHQIQAMAKQASQLLRPGGKFIAVVMGRKCILENLYYIFKSRKFYNRRKSKQPVPVNISDVTFPVWYYSPDEFTNLFQPWLMDPVLKPVGLFIPPSFINNYFSKSKLAIFSAQLLEKLSPAFPSLSDYADHYLVEMTKR